MNYKIFLSHSNIDKNWVNLIVTGSKLVGIETYLYEHDIQPGKSIAQKLQRAIKNSDAMVVLLTENSKFSPYVQQEIGFAEACDKLIIPLVQSGIGTECLAMLSGKEYIIFDTNNPLKSLSKLSISLQKLKKLKEAQELQKALIALFLLIIILALASGEN